MLSWQRIEDIISNTVSMSFVLLCTRVYALCFHIQAICLTFLLLTKNETQGATLHSVSLLHINNSMDSGATVEQRHLMPFIKHGPLYDFKPETGLPSILSSDPPLLPSLKRGLVYSIT